MIFIISNSQDATTDYLCEKIAASSLDYVRLNSDQILDNAYIEYDGTRPILKLYGRSILPEEISTLVFRRPKPLNLQIGKDLAEQNHVNQEWSEAIEGFLAHINTDKWMNHPAKNVSASHKIEQLSRANEFCLKVPKSLVTQNAEILKSFWTSFNGNIIAKPLALGFLERIPFEDSTQIYTNVVSADMLSKGIKVIGNCPTLFQEAILEKTDVRVTVVDETIYSVALKHPNREIPIDIRRDNMVLIQYEPIELPSSIRRSLLAILKSYGLRFAAIDMVVDNKNNWHFLEINPNGQWAWMDLVGATKIYQGFISAFQKGM